MFFIKKVTGRISEKVISRAWNEACAQREKNDPGREREHGAGGFGFPSAVAGGRKRQNAVVVKPGQVVIDRAP